MEFKLLEPWEKCIKLPGESIWRGMKSYCGREWNVFLVDLEHAELCIANATSIQPCPDCLEIARNDVTKVIDNLEHRANRLTGLAKLLNLPKSP